MSEVIERLKIYRKKSGEDGKPKTISALAKEFNTSEHNMHRWLNGLSSPNHASSLMIEASLPEGF